MEKVFLMGGSPMTGKSTAAMVISSKLKYAYMSTDVIGEIVQTVLPINPMQGLDYLDYYNINDIEKLISDVIQYHEKLKNPINRLIDIHSTWGNPLIMEGWAIYPENIASYSKNDVARVWIIAAESLLKKRLQASEGFCKASGWATEKNRLQTMLLQKKPETGGFLKQHRFSNGFIKVSFSHWKYNIVWYEDST